MGNMHQGAKPMPARWLTSYSVMPGFRARSIRSTALQVRAAAASAAAISLAERTLRRTPPSSPVSRAVALTTRSGGHTRKIASIT